MAAKMPPPITAPARSQVEMTRAIQSLQAQVIALQGKLAETSAMVQPPQYLGTPSNQLTPDVGILSGSLGASGGGFSSTVGSVGSPGSAGSGVGGAGGLGGAGLGGAIGGIG